MRKKDRAGRTIVYCPIAYYDISCLQYWLESKAKKGLYLTGSGFIGPFAIMEKRAAKDCRYRILPLVQRTSDDLEMYQLIEKLGWNYITDYRNAESVYYTDNLKLEELHSDSQVQIIEIQKAKKISLLYILFVFALGMIPLIFTLFYGTPVNKNTECGIFLLLEGVMFFLMFMSRWIHFASWKKRLIERREIDKKIFHSAVLKQWGYRVSILLLTIILIAMSVYIEMQ